MSSKAQTAAYILYAEANAAVLAWGIYSALIILVAADENMSVEQTQMTHGFDMIVVACVSASMIMFTLYWALMRHLGRRPIRPLGLKVLTTSIACAAGYAGVVWFVLMALSDIMGWRLNEGWTLIACLALVVPFTPWIVAEAKQRWSNRPPFRLLSPIDKSRPKQNP